MSKIFKHISIGVLIGVCLASCAIHQPMSEMVMFQEKKALAGASYYAKYSHSLASVNTDQPLEPALIHYTREHYPEERELSYSNPLSLTTSLIFLNKKHEKLGISLAIGPLIMGTGIDATYNVSGKYYLTAAGGMARGFSDFQCQFILQRRLLDGNPWGLSVGAVVRNRYRHIGITIDYLGEEHIAFYTQSVGIRSVLTLSPITAYGSPKLFLYGTGSINYDVTLNAFYPKIGVSLGIY